LERHQKIPLDHISSRDIDKLHELILQLDKIIFKLKPDADVHTELKGFLSEIKFDIDGLQHPVEQQAGLIIQLTPSSYLKGVVNSVLDSMSVDDTLAELKGKNN
jgi:hypothetical protein